MSNNPKNLEVGQEVWVYKNSRYCGSGIFKREITKVGRKYFYVGVLKFSLETLIEVEAYSPYKAKVYLSEKEYYDENEMSEIKEFLRRYFGDLNSHRDELSLEKLRQIKAIVEGEK